RASPCCLRECRSDLLSSPARHGLRHVSCGSGTVGGVACGAYRLAACGRWALRAILLHPLPDLGGHRPSRDSPDGTLLLPLHAASRSRNLTRLRLLGGVIGPWLDALPWRRPADGYRCGVGVSDRSKVPS